MSKTQKHRLHKRVLKPWRNDYLVYKYLWPNIEGAAATVLKRAIGRPPVILDIGCGHKPYRDLFPDATYFGMDRTTSDSSPDLVGDALNLPVRDQSVDIVFATQVIEHVPSPEVMIRECKRVLRPQGALILTGPFYWPLHEEPHDFFRFTKYGFIELLRKAGFSEWQVREDGGDWAQLMLTVNLRFRGRLMIPLICVVNFVGALLDKVSSSRKSPSNYTVMAWN